MDNHRLTGRQRPKPSLLAGAAVEVTPPDVAAATRLLDLNQSAWRLVLSLVWPALLQQLLVLIVTLSDRYLAGHLEAGDAEQNIASQAAQTTAFYLAWFISSYTVLVSVGATALVAHFIGAENHRAAVHITNQALLLAVVLGLLGSALALLALSSLVHGLGLAGPTADFAIEYLRPLFLLLVFQVIEAAGIACLAGAGDTRTGLWVRAGVAVLNLPLAWGLMHGWGPLPRLGFTGIAIGTAVSNVVGAMTVLAVLLHGRAGLRLHLPLMSPRWDLLWRLMRISVPAGADSLSVAVGQLWFLSIVNSLGDVAEAAHGIALGWEALGFLTGGAFGTAAITLVGQHLGAGRPDRASRSGWTAFALGGTMMTMMGVLFYSLAPEMFRVICPKSEQEPIVAAGVPVLRLVAFAMPVLASCIIFTSALRGAGDTRVPVLFTWFGFFVLRIPLAYALTSVRLDLGPLGMWRGANLGLLGAWLAMFADVLVRGLFFLARFASGRWKRFHV